MFTYEGDRLPAVDPGEVLQMIGKVYSTGLSLLRVLAVDRANPRTHLRVIDLKSDVEYVISAALVKKYRITISE